MLINLVNACDSVKCEVITIALRKMDAPEKHIKWVDKLHGNFEVILKAGRADITVKHGRGVIQGDNLVTTLFIIVI